MHNAYALTFGGLLLVGARAGDLLGRRRMFVAGIALFVGSGMTGCIPRLTRRLGNGHRLIGGIAFMLVGTAWLSRASVDTPYLTGIALPMIVYGIGQALGLSTLTAAGMAGVGPEDAGAASGLVNVVHHLGGAVGLGILVTVFAAAGSGAADPRELLADRVSAALTGAAVLLALALLVVLILRPRSSARVGCPVPETAAA